MKDGKANKKCNERRCPRTIENEKDNGEREWVREKQ